MTHYKTLTIGDMLNSPEIKAWDKFLVDNGCAYDSLEATQEFIEMNSRDNYDSSKEDVYLFDEHFVSWDYEYMTLEQGEEYLELRNSEYPFGFDYILRQDDPYTIWKREDDMGRYVRELRKAKRQ